MRLYYIGPAVHRAMTPSDINAKTRAAMAPIANLVAAYLLKDGLEALFALTALNPPYPPVEANQEKFGRYRVTRFHSEPNFRAAIIGAADPFDPSDYWLFRSLISCRSVSFGYDGQAFLCLHAGDKPPVSPDPSLIVVEDRSELLVATDYLDGVEFVDEPTESDLRMR